MTSTHDLPPVAGWWRGGDLEWRDRLGEVEDRAAQEADREETRAAFWDVVLEAKVAEGPQPSASEPQVAVDAALALTAVTPCELLLVPVEDLLGVEDQINLPGVVERHPNWRRRLPIEAPALFEHPDVRRRLDRLKSERPR